MTMVSELVLTRNQLMQIRPTAAGEGEDHYSTPLQRLNHVVSELQEGVMKTRMQPIGNAWSKLPRIVRDLALELDKKIDLQMVGQETELDRQVLDLIKDPLTHMVRNSGDHGIETPDIRKAAGKSETGTIQLNAFHQGGYIIIQIADDGKGLALDKIKEKAINNGLATPDELEAMSDSQITQFIFKAGFSTAEKVTSVSGRGVGMDVVRTNIEKIGGSIELDTKEGKGSTFTIKIPLTLAIVSALIVESGGERFAIPQLSVRELVLTGGDTEVENINGAPVLRLRNSLLPLVSLKKMLKLQGLDVDEDEDEDAENDGKVAFELSNEEYIVVTQIGSASFGIIVDRVYDTQEIVVKPVAGILKKIEIFSGNTILGDGTVIMILDPNGIARNIGDVEALERQAEEQQDAVLGDAVGETTSLLLFSAGDETPKAVPLALVSRLENVEVSQIERTGDRMLIQYRGRLMPLIPFGENANFEEHEEKPVLVFSNADKSLGLIVDEIIDIANEYIDVQSDSSMPGILGSSIIHGKATDMIDVGYYLQASDDNWFKDHSDDPFDSGDATTQAGGASKKKVLLVDDSPFFRNMLSPLLSVAGYDVTTLESPAAALQMCEAGKEFDIIISDIEMPEMNGFEFAQKVRDGGNWQETPMVALSSHATQQDMDKGREVGFTSYIAKFDRDTLLNTLSQTLSGNRGV
ncbi:MAG: chemotaxis protein CheW [Micavibrio sp.]|nr:chemotaxis protein CheW [Micavibrio sp.]